MRPIFLIILIITLVFSTSYLYYTLAAVCQVPLRYAIGEFDQGFPLSADEAMSALMAAEAVWEEATGRELFTYDGSASFLVNFIFDERQATIVAEETWREELDNNEATSAEVALQYQQALDEYKALEAAYKARVYDYERELAEFNQIVAEYNEEGGAPDEVYDELQAAQRKLNSIKQDLQAEAASLEALFADLNKLREHGNRLIEKYNEGVETYNTTFGQAKEFTQGDFQGDQINIYTFKDRNELVSVLVHEFGHALDIGHVEGVQSMMYYLMEDQPAIPVLSEADLAAFTAVCGTKDSFGSRVRVLVNKFI